MTISSTTRVAGPFTGNGTASAFPFAFKVFAAGDLDVLRTLTSTGVVTTLVLNSDYTVALNADQNTSPGGTVTLTGGNLATGTTLLVASGVDNTQQVDLTNQGGFYPEVINDALDRATIQVQQVQGQANRGIRYPDTEISLNAVLPKASDRANQYLAFDSTGAVDIGGAVPDQVYYGSKTSDPTTRNDGTARQAGDLYFNSVSNVMKVYNGSAWDTVTTTPVDGDKGDITISGGGATYTIDNNAVTTAKILNANVTAAKLATDSVETAKIVNLNVTTGKIADLGVTTGKIANGAVTSAKLDTNIAIGGTLNVTGQATFGSVGQSLINSSTAALSGSSTVISGIPSWARRVTVTIQNLSTTGTNVLLMQAGHSGSLQTSGYSAAGSNYVTANYSTNQFTWGAATSFVAAGSYEGRFVLERIGTTNDWIGTGSICNTSSGQFHLCLGEVALGGSLDRFALLVTAPQTFDAGNMCVAWE